ncbi:YpjP family protein [Bacillus salacetis]|uniref:YpjP family protein n=1 Tax=Bacillus salacetis TaxID=2315464 RepID=UPI003BA259A3
MSNWMRKTFVVLVSILTFGLVTPSQAFLNENENLNKSDSKAPSSLHSQTEVTEIAEEAEIDHGHFVQKMTSEAEHQAYMKFGSKIKPVIENEFQSIILPKIQLAIEETTKHFSENELSYLTISEVPAYAKSEKIFHIYDERSGEDIIRFHVRRDHPPLDGYYFNFHYHTRKDNFQEHHSLGDIFWDKNVPPQWNSLS